VVNAHRLSPNRLVSHHLWLRRSYFGSKMIGPSLPCYDVSPNTFSRATGLVIYLVSLFYTNSPMRYSQRFLGRQPTICFYPFLCLCFPLLPRGCYLRFYCDPVQERFAFSSLLGPFIDLGILPIPLSDSLRLRSSLRGDETLCPAALRISDLTMSPPVTVDPFSGSFWSHCDQWMPQSLLQHPSSPIFPRHSPLLPPGGASPRRLRTL